MKVSPAIQLTQFEDGCVYIHDGHHRCVATFLGGRHELRADEYELGYWKYNEYLEINPANRWFTPFDPRSHFRIADILAFKTEAERRHAEDPVAAEVWVRANVAVFQIEKTFHLLPDFAAHIRSRLEMGS